MNRSRSTLAGALALSLSTLTSPCQGETPPPRPPEVAAFLFAYHIKPGLQAQFDEGYRRHLAWHKQKKDTLLWYGWYVTNGERLGLFIDGSFGSSFGAFDQRVEPQADAVDFSQSSAPFCEQASRSTYRLRQDLSTGQPLESRQPSPLVQVTHFVLHPGMENRFEEVLGKLQAALKRAPAAAIHTWYQLVVGGEQPSYMLMVPRSGWADFDTDPDSISSVLMHTYGADQARGLLKNLSEAVDHAQSEMWSYHKDLSYFP